MINFLQKHKTFYKDAFLNMFAFALYIAAQQIVLFPLLAKKLPDDTYANIILFVSVMNIFCNVLGGQIGVTRQLRKVDYGTIQDEFDYRMLMLVASVIISVFVPLILFFLKADFVFALFLTATALLSNFRLYIRYYYRINNQFSNIIFQNLLYLLGIIIGIILMDIQWAFLPLFLGELFAVLFVLITVPRQRAQSKITPLFKETLNKYIGLGSADALLNSVTHIDKFLIYPLLGATNLAIYSAGAATGKIAAMVMNPLNEVILVRISKHDSGDLINLIKTILSAMAIVIVLVTLIMLPVIAGFSYVLYRQFFESIIEIIFILALASGIGTASSVMKSFILKLAKPKQLTLCYLFNLIVIVVFGCTGAYFAGLKGFALALVLSRLELLVSFVIVLLKLRNVGVA